MKIAAIALCLFIGCVAGDRVQLINLKPEEAQQYIANQALGINYARKLGETPLVQLRSLYGDDKKFYVNGRALENPEDYVQEDYLANQFHGQDGLGRVMFGYSDWNQGRLEARNANGEVRGQYQFTDPNGEDVEVKYWADSLGFHYSDNRPKIVLEPQQETEEVLAARAAHAQAWKEAALAAKAIPDPMSDVYNANANRLFEEQSKAEQTQHLLTVANQAQSFTRYPNLQHTIVPDKHGAFSHQDSVIINSPSGRALRVEPVEEVTSEPRGFFYSFDYPVHLIKEDPARARSIDSPKFKREEPKGTKVKISTISSTVAEITLPAKSAALPAALPSASSSDPSDSSSTNILSELEALSQALDEIQSNDIDQEPQVRKRREIASERSPRQLGAFSMFTSLAGMGLSALTSMAAYPAKAMAKYFMPKSQSTESDPAPSGLGSMMSNPMGAMGGLASMNPMAGVMGQVSKLNPMEAMNSMNPMNAMSGLTAMNPMNAMSGLTGMNPLKAMPGMGGAAKPTDSVDSEADSADNSRKRRQAPTTDASSPKPKADPVDAFVSLFGSALIEKAAAAQDSTKPKRQTSDPFQQLQGTSTTAPKVKRQAGDISGTSTVSPKPKRQTSDPSQQLQGTSTPKSVVKRQAGDISGTTTVSPKPKRQTSDPSQQLQGTSTTAPKVKRQAGDTTTVSPKPKRQVSDPPKQLQGTSTTKPIVKRQAGGLSQRRGSQNSQTSRTKRQIVPDTQGSTTPIPKPKRQIALPQMPKSPEIPKMKRQANPMDMFGGFLDAAAKAAPAAPQDTTSASPKPKRQIALPEMPKTPEVPKPKRQANPMDMFGGFVDAAAKAAPQETTSASPKPKRQIALPQMPKTPDVPKVKRQANPMDMFGGFLDAAAKAAPAAPQMPKAAPTKPETPKVKRQVSTSTLPPTRPTLVEMGGIEVFPIDLDDSKIQATQ